MAEYIDIIKNLTFLLERANNKIAQLESNVPPNTPNTPIKAENLQFLPTPSEISEHDILDTINESEGMATAYISYDAKEREEFMECVKDGKCLCGAKTRSKKPFDLLAFKVHRSKNSHHKNWYHSLKVNSIKTDSSTDGVKG
jgi:hypothetical protein